MKIIEPLIEVEKYDGISIMKNIERACRTCYRSEGSITEDSYKKLLNNCISRGHQSVLEHEKITIRMTCDIGVYKDLTRHRFGSFSIESTRYCVAGNTKLKFKNPHNKYTISELYDLVQNSKNGSWKRMQIRQLNENTGELQYSKIKNIYQMGTKKCYNLTTDLHYELICTADHQIYTPNGYVKLQNLNVNDYVYVNGQSVAEPLYSNYDWLYHQYITLNKSYREISNEFGYVLSTVKKWGHKFKLPYKGCGYKNVGREPWNKNLSESDDLRVKNQANALRKNRYDKWKSDEYDRAPNGQAILEATDRVYKKYRKDYCEICGRTNCKLEVHHKDGDHNNFDETNFITGCPKCHQGIENKSLEILYADKIISIEDVGELEVYDIEMDNDNHNFIANGVVVHNCNYGKDKFDNEIKFIKPIFYNPTPSQYAGEECLDENEALAETSDSLKTELWKECMQHIEGVYVRMSKFAKPDELRMLLPHSTAAQVTMTANIREWRHILGLRASKMSHPAIQQLLIPLLLKFKEDMPELFEDIEYNTEFPKEKYAKLVTMGEENV